MEQRTMEPARVVPRRMWRDGSPSVGSRSVPEETAVALTYNGGTHPGMIATAQEFCDFWVGFPLPVGVVLPSLRARCRKILAPPACLPLPPSPLTNHSHPLT